MIPIRRHACLVAIAVLAAGCLPALHGQQPAAPGRQQPAAAAPDLPVPDVAVASVVEDQQKLLRATVTLKGKPLEGTRVRFGVARTFGVLDLGSDVTLEDGTAAVPFPEGLPGGATGTIQVVASVEATKEHAPASARISATGAAVVVPEPVPFPHALWSSKPLWPLVSIIVLLLAGVWGTYCFVVRQLLKIRKAVTS
jgi:hypothetical protein